MYSATAASVARLRARYAELDDDAPGWVRSLVGRRLESAEQRLIDERDPVQREVLAAAEAEQQTATSVMKKLASAMKVSTAMKKMTSPLKRITKSVFSRLSAIMERRRAEREARRVAFLAVVARIEAATDYARMVPIGNIADVPPPPPRLLDVASLVAAPRPGPVAGATLAA